MIRLISSDPYASLRLASLICLLACTLTVYGCATKNTDVSEQKDSGPVSLSEGRLPAIDVLPSTVVNQAFTTLQPAPESHALSNTDPDETLLAPDKQDAPVEEPVITNTRTALVVNAAQRVGSLEGAELREISGISSSQRYPGIMYAINDSGNAPRLYALSETGQLIESWDVAARNRDWEDMSHIVLEGTSYLIISDTGNNTLSPRNSRLLLLPEPEIPAKSTTLKPARTVQFDYSDGPHNVEAVATIGRSVYLLSKEPVRLSGPARSGVYRLDLPEDVLSSDENTTLRANLVTTMPLRKLGIEASLAASLAGIDLTHPTAMSYDPITDSFYVLTYREVLRISKNGHSSWKEAFSSTAQRVLSQNLPQAEALTLSGARTLIFTSEHAGAPVWAIPLEAPSANKSADYTTVQAHR